jgi:hypothetical protein
MGFCRRCGKKISDRYSLCYQCNLESKTYVDRKGYLRFNDGGVPIHRVVASKMLGRKLRPWEVVHHKDRDKLNNDQQNLWVCSSQGEHDELHQRDAERFGPSASYQGFKKRKARN